MAQTIDNIVDPNDSSLTSEMVQFPGPAGNVSAYVSRPKDGKNLGTVVVIHENRGLIGHIKDVARHFAKDGFAAIAVDCMGRGARGDGFAGVPAEASRVSLRREARQPALPLAPRNPHAECDRADHQQNPDQRGARRVQVCHYVSCERKRPNRLAHAPEASYCCDGVGRAEGP